MGSSFLPWAYLLSMLIPFTKAPPPPPRAHLLTSSDLRFQHLNIDSDYSHDPGTLPQQTPSQAPHGSDGPVNSQGLVNVYVSVLMLYSQDFLPFFPLSTS